MKHLNPRMKASMPLFAICCLIWLFVFGGLSSPIALGGASAATNTYLQVRAADLTVGNFGIAANKYYQISLDYGIENVNLPQTNNYGRYGLTDENNNTFTVYTQSGEVLNLRYISANGTQKSLLMMFYLAADGDKVAFTESLEKIVVKKDSKLLAPPDYSEGMYAGIQFAEDITLVNTDGSWSVGQSVQTEQTETYEVALTKENVSLAWEDDLLKAKIAVPFSRETDVEYTYSLTAYKNGYEEDFKAVQYAKESSITLLFENYAHESEDVPFIQLQDGDLTDSENKTAVVCSGDITFYEYIDKTWETEKYICVREILNGTTSERKTSATETYTFVTPEMQTDKLWLGWKHDGNVYQAGDSIGLSDYENRTLQAEAAFVGYGLIDGASIRYDQTGAASGIRFASQLNTDDFTANKDIILGVGIILMPHNLLGTKEFTLENYSDAGYAKSIFIASGDVSFGDSNIFTLYASIVKVLEINYNRAFLARAYLLIDDGGEERYVWDSEIVSRSIYFVASAALEKDKQSQTLKSWQKTILETYVNGVANIGYENGVTTVFSESDTIVIESAATEINGRQIVLKLTTTKQKFAAITYNGQRVKSAQQTYAEGVLTVTFEESNLENLQ